jgi:hypothetical protein
MKSKLTLRLDAQVKEQAKEIARKKGTSVSKLVEDYFQLLVDEAESNQEGNPSSGADDTAAAPPLPPRIQKLKETLGQPAPTVQVDEDTRAWIEAAAEKHA